MDGCQLISLLAHIPLNNQSISATKFIISTSVKRDAKKPIHYHHNSHIPWTHKIALAAITTSTEPPSTEHKHLTSNLDPNFSDAPTSATP